MNTSNNKPEHPSVIILAAGLSRRMGFPKPFLKWDEKKTFLEKIISEYYAFGTREIIVVMNEGGYAKEKNEFPDIEQYAKIVINKVPEKGRFRSLAIGLNSMTEIKNCFLQNVDNPFVNYNLLSGMSKLVNPNSFVVPVIGGKNGNPVLISCDICKHIVSLLEHDHDLHEVLHNFNKIEYLSDDSNLLLNINTMKEYESIIKK